VLHVGYFGSRSLQNLTTDYADIFQTHHRDCHTKQAFTAARYVIRELG
jgi:aryl-alcohol dehydrogenase-like predicted oxidoreductase